MPLAAGDKLGPYEIISLIGKGGMGEVYMARDPRLGREVAIKVSTAQFTERFEREARAIAALNHPNICSLFDVGPNFLVMEYVEGEAPEGPLPLEEALRIAKQIAEALGEAHEKGVTHRDLKPANIKVKADGTVKVLDFGLAKIDAGSAGSQSENSPTLSMAATQMGVILGTAGYMSPEQARGKPADKRADIWAFGVVLYELLTGKRLFQGEDVSHTMAAVIMQEPKLDSVPVQVRRLLKSCLEKEPKNRLRDIADVWRLLDEEQPAAAPAPGMPKKSMLPWALSVGVLVALIAGLGYFVYRHVTEEPARMLQFSVLPPDKTAFAASTPAISPDGRRVALSVAATGQTSIWIRNLDAFEARPLPGTEGGVNPFWSPDGRFLAFFADGKLKKIDLAGGPALILTEALAIAPGSWSKDDVILYTPSIGGLSRISASGGAPVVVTMVEAGSEVLHVSPCFLPDGRHFLYLAVSPSGKSAIYAGELDSKTRRRVLEGSTSAVYTPSADGKRDFLLFARDRTLMAQPFDAAKAELSGDPVPIADQVDHPGGRNALFSASQNGAIVYATSGAGSTGQLTWFDRSGKPGGTVGPPGVINWPAISPDGTKVVFDRLEPRGGSNDLWMHDLTRGGESRFTFGPVSNIFPVWSPDGSHVAFTSIRQEGLTLAQRATNGAAQDEILDKDPRVKRPTDWSRDGKYIFETTPADKTSGDVWVLPLQGSETERKPFPYLQTEFNENFSRLSPNGLWLAYSSNESKRDEVYVQTFPTKGGKWQVSINGGDRPIWSRDGKELYFIGADGKMMAVEIKGGSNFDRGAPVPLFDSRIGFGAWFDVGKDGRFLIPVPAEQSSSAPVNVIVNWQAGLKK